MSRIGVCIKHNDSLFTNGCIQQAYFTYKCIKYHFKDIDFVTIDKECKTFGPTNEKVVNIVDDIQSLRNYRLIIFSSLFIHHTNLLNMMKMLGIRIVNMMVGNFYILNCEEFVFNVHGNLLDRMHNPFVDRIWLMPMYKHNMAYTECITKKQVSICPHVWDSSIIDDYIKTNNLNMTYPQCKNTALDIIIMEPNLSIHKNALPLLCLLNQYFCKNPHKIKNIYVFGKKDFHKDKIKFLDISICNKIVFYSRTISAVFYNNLNKSLSNYCVLSTNIRNGLNFLHLECFYLGIPIIHNCEKYSDNGLYYEESDTYSDYNIIFRYLDRLYKDGYQHNHSAAKKILNTYATDNSENINDHTKLIDSICNDYKKPSIDAFITSVLARRDNIEYRLDNDSRGVIVIVNKQYKKDIVFKNLLYILNCDLENTVYVLLSEYDKFSTELQCFLNDKNTKNSVNIVACSDIEFFPFIDCKYRYVAYVNSNIICNVNIADIIKNIENSTLQFLGFSISEDIHDSNIIKQYLSYILEYIHIKAKDVPLLDNNFFVYKNSQEIRGVFQNYSNNLARFKYYIDNRFIKQMLFSMVKYRFKVIYSQMGVITYDDKHIVGYFIKNDTENNILYTCIDVNLDSINIDKIKYIENVKSYQYLVNDNLLRMHT